MNSLYDKKPLLSICIPSYNRKDLLSRSIEELLKYPNDDLEIVIVDNASNDGTWEYIQSISDPRVRSFRNPENRGAGYNYKKALISGRGYFCQHLNDRDYIDHFSLSKYMDYLRDCDGDVIIIGRQDKCSRLNLEILRDRSYAYFRTSHAGLKAYSQIIISQYRDYWNKVIENNPRLWDNVNIRMTSLCVLNYNWKMYDGGQVLSYASETVSLKQYRVTKGVRAYFTPEARVSLALHYMINDFIPVSVRNEYLSGIYRSFASVLLPDYYSAISSYKENGGSRYPDFKPPKRAFFMAAMIKYYRGVVAGIKRYGYDSIMLRYDFLVGSIKEYLSFLVRFKIANICIRISKVVFPEKVRKRINQIVFNGKL